MSEDGEEYDEDAEVQKLQDQLTEEGEKNTRLKQEESARALLPVGGGASGGGGPKGPSVAVIKLQRDLEELKAANSLLETGRPLGSKAFHDVDGRLYHLHDIRGAAERAEASLCFRRMMNDERQMVTMSGQKLDIDSEKLKGRLAAFSERFLFAETVDASEVWASASLYQEVCDYPLTRDEDKWRKFLMGKWTRYDFAQLSLSDFVGASVFDESSLDSLRSAVTNIGIALFCVFGQAWNGCTNKLLEELRTSAWKRRIEYLRFVLENFF